MLVKEYRIPMPFTVEEYRIAQLYMIQRKSREESEGAGSGVEIINNEPYTNGPNDTSGQYTFKIYHVGSRLPSWLRAILPKTALQVHEEAWNAYPYTKTIFRCPFVEKFSITIETVYKQDGGIQENVFNLDNMALCTRLVDLMDFVRDSVPPSDYKAEEDPTKYVSEVTGRGPLSLDWLKERMVTPSAGPVMCAYKLCWVEFKYWGMQSKIERFIDESALRKTMVRAHRQAWAWQDEWHGLTIEKIRDLEGETQRALARKMGDLTEPNKDDADGTVEDEVSDVSTQALVPTPSDPPTSDDRIIIRNSTSDPRTSWASIEKNVDDSDDEFYDAQSEIGSDDLNDSRRKEPGETHLLPASSLEILAENNFESSCSNGMSLDQGMMDSPTRMIKEQHLMDSGTNGCSISTLFIVIHGGNALLVESDRNSKMSDVFTLKSTFERVVSTHYPSFLGRYQVKLVACPPIHSDALNLLSSISPYSHELSDSGSQVYSEHFPISAVPLLASNSMEYQNCLVTIVNRANKVYRDFILSDEGHAFNGQVVLIGDCMGSVMAFDILCSMSIDSTTFSIGPCNNNKKYASDTNLAEGESPLNSIDLSGCDLADVGTRPKLVNTRKAATLDLPTTYSPIIGHKPGLRVTLSGPGASLPASRLQGMASPTFSCASGFPPTSSRPPGSTHLTGTHSSNPRLLDSRGFDFEVSEFFMFGSPLAIVLANRIIQEGPDVQTRPSCFQLYNMFHASDPCSGRLESLLESSFSRIETVRVPQYQRFPLGDGQPLSLLECLQRHGLHSDGNTSSGNGTRSGSSIKRQESNASYLSSSSADVNISSITRVARKWWGTKRVDYTMYCPEGLENFPNNALPHLFHASFWESLDAASFILRQLLAHEYSVDIQHTADAVNFSPQQPREKWQQKRTGLKTKNITPNHRGNDVLVLTDKPQMLSGRFMYGPLDLVTLSHEKVDVHMITDPHVGEWEYLGTNVTDKYGRVNHVMPFEKRLPFGLYPVKMVVRGDHTYTDLSLLVLPPHTNVVVFSIDGSFTASVSIMGKDPKVRPGAVDVVRFEEASTANTANFKLVNQFKPIPFGDIGVAKYAWSRYWQDLGYCILYISARPDMQLRKVVSWLAQHNFPHGMVAFMDGLSADPIRQKTAYLKQLIKEAQIDVVAAYGSYKDIGVYQSCSIKNENIYVIGKTPKKAFNQAVVLVEGYAAHLQLLQRAGKVAPSTSNVRFLLEKSSFPLPAGKNKKLDRSTSVKHSTNSSIKEKSCPIISVDTTTGKTNVDISGHTAGKSRGRINRGSRSLTTDYS